MGATDNDANRCNFLYSDDRRCRNLTEFPGGSLCYFHAGRQRKKDEKRPPDKRPLRAFYDWLACHPLDNVTHIYQAINQIFLLLVGERISRRQADTLTRMARLLLQMVPEVRDESAMPYINAHRRQSVDFFAEMGDLLDCSAPGEPRQEAPPPASAEPPPASADLVDPQDARPVPDADQPAPAAAQPVPPVARPPQKPSGPPAEGVGMAAMSAASAQSPP